MRLNWGWPVKAVYGLPLADSATCLCIYSLVLQPPPLSFCPACTCYSLGQFNWESHGFVPTQPITALKPPPCCDVRRRVKQLTVSLLMQRLFNCNFSKKRAKCEVPRTNSCRRERKPDFLFYVASLHVCIHSHIGEIKMHLIFSFNHIVYRPNNCTLDKGFFSSATTKCEARQIKGSSRCAREIQLDLILKLCLVTAECSIKVILQSMNYPAEWCTQPCIMKYKDFGYKKNTSSVHKSTEPDLQVRSIRGNFIKDIISLFDQIWCSTGAK